jgi:hypothetical protein
MKGLPASAGISVLTCCNRSDTCCLAQYTSVLSLKTIVTRDNPKREKERISMIPGTLAVACSMGNVMRRSTSGAAKEGDTVITCTWLFVISGTASMGSFGKRIDSQPINPTLIT